MFRTVPLSIIRSFSLYIQQRYMSYRFSDSLRAGSGWNCSSILILLGTDGTFSGLKRPWREVDHLRTFSDDVKNELSEIAASPNAFMTSTGTSLPLHSPLLLSFNYRRILDCGEIHIKVPFWSRTSFHSFSLACILIFIC